MVLGLRQTAIVVACAIAAGLALVPALSSEDQAQAKRLSGQAALDQAKRAGIDVGSVIETVRHRVEPAKGRADVLVSVDRLYQAEFGDAGISLRLLQKQAERTPSFAIETTSARSGAVPLPLSPQTWRSESNSVVRRLSSTLRERVTSREGSLEWDFLLSRAPAGHGALTIEARVSTPGRATRRGPRFSLGAGRGVLVGELVVEDVHGRELYRALPGVSGHRLSLTVPQQVLNEAAYPLTIDPIVSPEYPTSDPVVGAAQEEQTEPAVAFDGTNYLVVWRDAFQRSMGIYGTRVSREGAVLDPSGITIHTGRGSLPAVSFGAEHFLVVWSRCVDSRCRDHDVIGARVSPKGAVLDPGGIPISTGPPDQYAPAVAFDGANWLVAWQRGSDPSRDIYAARVSPKGIVLDASGIPISTAPVDQVEPAVDFDGRNYLVVWSAYATPLSVSGARVSPAGLVLDPAGIQISIGGSQARLAFDGTNYLVVWTQAWSRVYGARVSPGGQVLDPAGFPISPTGNPATPDIAFDGANYLVVWRDGGDFLGARVTPGGTVLDPNGIRIWSAATWYEQEAPAVAFDGTNYLVVWPRRNGYLGDYGPRTDIAGSRVTPTGRVLDASPILLSTDLNEQDLPAVAFDGTNYLIAWRDTRPGWGEVYAARVSRAGDLLDPTGIRVATSPEAFIEAPALAFDGTNYLLAWSQWTGDYASQIRGARVSTDGSVLDPDGIEIAEALLISKPIIDFDGKNYFVAWVAYEENRGYEVWASRVSTSGQVLDPNGIAIAAAGTWPWPSPGVAFGGENYLVTWPDLGGDIYGTRVDTSGNVLDPDGFMITSRGSPHEQAPVAFDGANYVVAWHDMRAADANIYAARVSQDGLVLDPSGIPISTAQGPQQRPAISFDGTNSLVAWEDARTPGGFDLFGARLSPAGEVLDPSGIPISTATGDELRPAVARGPSGETAVVYERRRRVFLRFVSEGPAPLPCSCSAARR